MKNLSLNKSAAESRITDECAEMLKRKGAVLLLPTETVYGFMCRWDDSEARERIYIMKKRSADKPFQMLASSIGQAEEEGLILDGAARRIAEKFFPGPLTLVVKNRNGSTTGLRIPNHQFILNIMDRIDSPLAATSANISGEPAALTLEDALRNLEILPDLAVDGGKIEAGAASTVVDASSTPFKILRPGPIKEEEIRKAGAENNY
jgi:L-threonylcarbamoyladenylate synthase